MAKKFPLIAGSPADAESCIVINLRTTAALKAGDIVKVVNNFTVDRVANDTEQAWGIISGKWDGNKDCVPVIISGLVYMPADAVPAAGANPKNICIFTFGVASGKIQKTDGSISDSVALAWINL